MSLDLNKLAKNLDEALIKETNETLTKFLNDKRMTNETKTIKEVVDYLNELKIEQTSIEFDENNFPENIYEKYFENGSCLAEELDINKHRWYETGLSVWEIKEGLLGVRIVTKLYSENSDIEDIYHTLKFFEMEEITVTSYKQKI